jgi:phage tail-like protein
VIARDPNQATWLALRYREDVLPWSGAAQPAGPRLDASLGYDANAGVLELLPDRPRRMQRPMPGLAVQPDGEAYVADPRHGVLIVRCDGSRTPLVCGHRWCDVAGMALDRRGFLFVCDRGAHEVLVVSPEDGALRARLRTDDLSEPVDVAIATDGTIYVADRGGGDPLGTRAGAIHVFDIRFNRRARWVPHDDRGLPAVFRPIGVWLEADGSVMVADASHPRLLRLDAGGGIVAEPELRDVARPVLRAAAGINRLDELYGDGRLRRFAGSCCRGLNGNDAGAKLAAVHGALRLLHIRLARRFHGEGAWTTRVLDGRLPATQWHRIDLDVDLPPGTSLIVETVSAEQRDDLITNIDALAPAPDELVEAVHEDADDDLPVALAWRTVRDRDGRILAFTSAEAEPATVTGIRYDARRAGAMVREALVCSPPGRYLRIRVRFQSDGLDTPQLRALVIRYPRNSWLDLLPAVYRRDQAGADFLSRYLALTERTLTGIEKLAERFVRELNPAAASHEMIDWLACLVDLTFDPSWNLAKRRALVGEAMSLWATRGTPAGLARYVEIYTGIRPLITEAFRERPTHPVMGSGRSGIIGQGLVLGGSVGADLPPDEALMATYAHRFTVVLPIAAPCDIAAVLPVVERIIKVNKPAHTGHTLRTVSAGGGLELASTVGIDLILGGSEAQPLQLPDPTRDITGAILGQDAVLGGIRPTSHPPDPVL